MCGVWWHVGTFASCTAVGSMLLGCQAFASLPLLCGLYLHYNSIGDAGFCQLAGGLAAGLVPKLVWLQASGSFRAKARIQARLVTGPSSVRLI